MIPQRGIYTVGKETFYDKIPALKYATVTNQQVSWSYGDDFFSACDWSVEPAETLSELYIERCQQLRDDYEYLILYYSGGSDSANILSHFIQAGIHIDEIVSWWPLEYFEKKKPKNTSTENTETQNEWYYTALPALKRLSSVIPNTKITILDYTQDSIKFDLPDNWLDVVGEAVNIGMFHRLSRFSSTNTRRVLEKKKTALIYGIDKPRVFRGDDNEYYIAFLDTIVALPPRVPAHIDPENAVSENFYWSDKSFQILSKQGHMLKKFFQDHENVMIPPSFRKLEYSDRQFYDSVIRSVVYPYWGRDTFQVDKPTSLWLNENEEWINQVTPRGRDVWLSQYNELTNEIDPRFFQSIQGQSLYGGFTGLWSKWHKL